MVRVAVYEILLFVLPFAVFALFLLVTRGSVGKEFLEGPLVWLALAGLVLFFAGLVFFATFTGAPIEGDYVPPRYEDGVVVPGHVEPREGSR
jgi:hypothetical protein